MRLGYYNQSYGKATRVHALKTDSPPIDAGDTAYATYVDRDLDQRGRIVDWDNGDLAATVDIGAVELAFDEVHTWADT